MTDTNFFAASHVAVVGLGLIGGSLSLALRRCGLRIRGIDRNPRTLARARMRGALSHGTTRISAGIQGANLVVLCVPVQEMSRCLREVAAVADRRTVVTDTASVKGAVLREAQRWLRYPRQFVGGHPMAGSERSGLKAADGGLFRGRCCVLTPVRDTSPSAVRAVTHLWRRCGARVLKLAPARHDRLVARISHLPHAVAVALMRAGLAERAAARLVAGSFLDATRVAASSPELWRGIFLANRAEVLAAIDAFKGRLNGFQGLLRRADPRALYRTLRIVARDRRRQHEPTRS